MLHADDGRVLTPFAASSDASEPRPTLDVVMDNTPPANPSAGGVTFRWHRNSMLPSTRVFVKAPTDAGPLLDGAAVLLSAVTIDVLSNSARSVGLEGTCLQPLINRECTFSSLSFRTTSFNLPGKPAIHLMATLLVRGAAAADGADGAAGEALDRCVCSFISPALIVDARNRKRQSAKEPQGAAAAPAHLVAAGVPTRRSAPRRRARRGARRGAIRPSHSTRRCSTRGCTRSAARHWGRPRPSTTRSTA